MVVADLNNRLFESVFVSYAWGGILSGAANSYVLWALRTRLSNGALAILFTGPAIGAFLWILYTIVLVTVFCAAGSGRGSYLELLRPENRPLLAGPLAGGVVSGLIVAAVILRNYKQPSRE